MNRLLVLAFLLCPSAQAQDDPLNTDTKGLRFEKKAKDLAKEDRDFAKLDEDDQQVVIQAIAEKLQAVRDRNRKLGRYKQKVTGADIFIKVADTDLDALKAKYPNLAKKAVIEREWTKPAPPPTETRAPAQFEINEIEGQPFHDLFKDNEWALQPESCESAQLKAQLDEAVSAAGKDGRITGISIESSASTLRNTGPAASLSWKELSQKRAEAARDFALAYLKSEHHVALAEGMVTIDSEGENGDGTSGPADPYKKGAPGNGKEPYAELEKYNEHKFVNVAVSVYQKVEKPGAVTLTQEPGKKASELVVVDLDTKEHARWWRFRLPKLEFQSRRREPRPKNRGKYRGQCPKF